MKIVITAKSEDPAVVAAVRGVTGLPIAKAKDLLATGGVLLEGEPVANEDLPSQMRGLLEALRRHAVEPVIYELSDEAELADATDADRITPDAVERIIKRGELVGEQQTRQSRREAEALKDKDE